MKWEVFRQELLVYHARHKRIKFIFEDGGHGQNSSNDGFGRYRQHAQGILNSLRDIFNELPKGTEIVSSKDKSTDKDISLNIPLTKKINPIILLKYLKYWQLCQINEGWNESSASYKVIDQIIGQIRSDHKEICIENQLNQKTLTDLLSTLPVLPHWDIWGLSSKKSKKYQSNLTITAKIADSIESLAYGVQLKFNTPNVKSSRGAKDSRSLLGYPARVRLCFANTDTNYQKPIFTTEEDYYTFCHYPGSGNKYGNEKQLYLAYGLLFDALIKALNLGSSDNAPKTTKSQNEISTPDSQSIPASGKKLKPKKIQDEESIYFYVAYPITTLQGRRHFWHIWLRPEGDTQQNASLEDLWASWWPIHQRFLNWPVLHAALASELEQLDIAYAQEGIQAKIQKNAEKKISEKIDEIISQFSYSLFPVSCVCDNEGNVWGYEKYSINTLDEIKDFPKKDRDLKLHLGYEWKKFEGKDNSRGNRGANGIVCKKDCFSYKKHNDSGGMPKIIFNDLGIQTDKNRLRYQHGNILLEKQQYLAEKLFKANSHEREIVERANRAMQEQLRQYFTEKSISIAWRDGMLDRLNVCEDWSGINFEDQGTDLKNPKSGKAFLNYQEIAQFLSREDNCKEQFKLLLEGGLHMFLSMLLETGPVKYLSHSLSVEAREKLCAIWTQDSCDAFLTYTLRNLKSVLSTINSQSPIIKHIDAVNNNYIELYSSENTACPKEKGDLNKYAVELMNMRKKYEDCKKYIDMSFKEGPGKQSISFLGSDPTKTIRYGQSFFRVSLPIDHIFQQAHLKALRKLVPDNQTAFYRLFALTNNQKLVPGETNTFTNYLAFAYQVDIERPPPNLFQEIDEHLKSIGGNLFVVLLVSDAWQWMRIGRDDGRKYLPTNSPSWPERYDGKDHPNQNEYNLLFKDDRKHWNCIILFTFHGYFIEE